MGKVLGGFLVGFGLATAIFFSIIFAILSPYSSQITDMYQTTQSGWYNTAIQFLNGLKGVAGNPIISAIIGSNPSSIIGSISDFLSNARQTISILYTLMTITIPAIVVSVIMIIVGGIVASRHEKTIFVPIKDEKGKHCPHCGEKVSRGDKFCPECGKKV